MSKFIYLKRVGGNFNGDIVDVPESQVAETLKAHPTWIVVDDGIKVEVEVAAPAVDEKIECPLCGRKFKNDKGLKIHKATH